VAAGAGRGHEVAPPRWRCETAFTPFAGNMPPATGVWASGCLTPPCGRVGDPPSTPVEAGARGRRRVGRDACAGSLVPMSVREWNPSSPGGAEPRDLATGGPWLWLPLPSELVSLPASPACAPPPALPLVLRPRVSTFRRENAAAASLTLVLLPSLPRGPMAYFSAAVADPLRLLRLDSSTLCTHSVWRLRMETRARSTAAALRLVHGPMKGVCAMVYCT